MGARRHEAVHHERRRGGLYTVFAKTDPDAGHDGISAFIVEADTPGFEVARLEEKLGIARLDDRASSSSTAAAFPADAMLGEEGEGFRIAMRILDRSRPGVAAQALGIAQGATDYALEYARTRETMGKPIAQHQLIAGKLADMETATEAARGLLYRYGRMVDEGAADDELTKASAMAKLYCGDVAMQVTVDAVQILGGYGYVKEYPVERFMRDAKITQIYEGTQEIQRIVIAREMLKETRSFLLEGVGMTSISVEPGESARRASPAPPLRVVTAASLFDGHDAAINVMRRLIQAQGAEVIHLGHNRGVAEIVRAAIQEDADAIAVSSYQGGHVEYFRYMVEMLRERGAGHIRVFGGGGGTITPPEIAELEAFGVERIYHPNDGLELGLTGMIDDLVARAAARPAADRAARARGVRRRPRGRRDALRDRGRRARPARRSTSGSPRGRRRAPARPSSGSPAPAAPARAPSPTRSWRGCSSGSRSSRSRSSPSTRRAAAPAAPCSATGSG